MNLEEQRAEVERLLREYPIVTDRARLKTVSEEFDFESPQRDPLELSRLLVDRMDAARALGLSAIQIDVPLRVFCMATQPRIVCFNPRIVDRSDEMIELDEGCLSVPNMTLVVKRPTVVRVQYTLPNGHTDMYTYGDMTARIFQHEMDHLDGVLFYERVSRFHRDRAFRKKAIASKRARR